MATYEKVNDTTVKVIESIESFQTLDMLLRDRKNLLNNKLSTNTQIDAVDTQFEAFRALGVMTQAEYDAQNAPEPTE